MSLIPPTIHSGFGWRSRHLHSVETGQASKLQPAGDPAPVRSAVAQRVSKRRAPLGLGVYWYSSALARTLKSCRRFGRR